MCHSLHGLDKHLLIVSILEGRRCTRRTPWVFTGNLSFEHCALLPVGTEADVLVKLKWLLVYYHSSFFRQTVPNETRT